MYKSIKLKKTMNIYRNKSIKRSDYRLSDLIENNDSKVFFIRFLYFLKIIYKLKN